MAVLWTDAVVKQITPMTCLMPLGPVTSRTQMEIIKTKQEKKKAVNFSTLSSRRILQEDDVDPPIIHSSAYQ